MRIFVFLLVLTNLLFFVWTQGYLGSPSTPDAFRIQQQLLADKIKVVARDEPPTTPARDEKVDKPEEKKAAEICLRLGDLPVEDATRFENVLTEKLPAFKSLRTTNTVGTSYWVSIPPLATKQDAENKATELRKLQVTDFFIVQDNGPNNRAISLGLFSTKEAAASHLETLRAKGVRSAKVTERNSKPTSASLEIHGPETQQDVLLEAMADVLPKVRSTACKPSTSAQ